MEQVFENHYIFTCLKNLYAHEVKKQMTVTVISSVCSPSPHQFPV